MSDLRRRVLAMFENDRPPPTPAQARKNRHRHWAFASIYYPSAKDECWRDGCRELAETPVGLCLSHRDQLTEEEP